MKSEVNYVKATDVRNNFQDTVDGVHYTKKPVVITKRNKPWAIIVSLPEGEIAADNIINKVTGVVKK